MMMERIFFGLTTKSNKRRAFKLAIKMGLSVYFQYKREQQAGSGCQLLSDDGEDIFLG